MISANAKSAFYSYYEFVVASLARSGEQPRANDGLGPRLKHLHEAQNRRVGAAAHRHGQLQLDLIDGHVLDVQH